MQYEAMLLWPKVSRTASDILLLFGSESAEIQAKAQRALGVKRPILGNDLEFVERQRYVEEPTILGVSDGALSVSVPFNEGLPYFQELIRRYPDVLYVGHAFTSADLFAFRNVGINLDVTAVQDTIIWWYLTSAHLCKSGAKVEDGDGEKRGKGYMNLWSFISVHTSLPNWKECRGKECDGTYCPEHEPFGYNGVDSVGPVLALPSVVSQARMRGVDKLYSLHRDLAYVLAEMARYGVQTDIDYIDQMEREFVRDKAAIAEQLPFNPKSNQEAVAYFKAKGIVLANWQETTIRETLEDVGDDELALALDYKEMGNGTDRWFKPIGRKANGDWEGYRDAAGKVHPRLGMFTSTGRFQCTSPNLQNVSTRRKDRKQCECGTSFAEHVLGLGCGAFNGVSLGKKVRRAIVATPGWYLLKADYSNAENRNFLFLAGCNIPTDKDLHTWVAEISGFTADMEIVKLNGSPRQAAKTVQHGSNYLEGIQLKTPAELRTGRPKQEIDFGCREVWPNWTFNDKVVTFTGANLAQRVFGDKSFENRKKALEILNRYFSNFPQARALQQRITAQCERQKAVITPHGYYLQSYGPDEERMKTAAAMWGSNPIAHLTKLALVDLWRKFAAGRPMRPVLQVHDEILCEVRDDVPPDTAAGWLRESMEIETPEIPGLIVPTDAAYGPNWRDCRKINR